MSALTMTDALPLLDHWPEAGGAAELLLKQSRSRLWSMAGGIMDTTRGRERGSAVRVVLPDGRCSLVTAASPSFAGLTRDLDRARLLAELTAPDPHLTLPGPAPGAGLQPLPATGGSPSELFDEDAARALLDRLLEPDTRCARVVKAWVRQAEVGTELVNSTGFAGSHRGILTSLGVLLDGGGEEPLVHEELLTAGAVPAPDRFLETARSRAAGLFGARGTPPGPTGSLVLTPEAAAPLLAALGTRFVPLPCLTEGPGLPPPGTRVAPAGITLVDDGRHPGGPRSAPFDGEGTAAGTTVLVRDGILRSLVHDRRSASRSGTRSTGNAVRDSYRQGPAPGLTTLVLHPRPDLTEDDLLGDISRGLYAVVAAPPDPDRLEAGIFSIRFRGRLINRGRLLSPTGPVAFRLALDDLLPRLRAAAGRPRLIALDGSVETPLLRLDGVRLDSC